MRNRIKQCYYCNEDFQAKRIDAMYCSDSCKMMAYRREKDPLKYQSQKPIHFELDSITYGHLKDIADNSGLEIEEYIKELCGIDQEYNYVKISKDMIHELKSHLAGRYKGTNWYQAFRLWLVEMYATDKLTQNRNQK